MENLNVFFCYISLHWSAVAFRRVELACVWVAYIVPNLGKVKYKLQAYFTLGTCTVPYVLTMHFSNLKTRTIRDVIWLYVVHV